MLGRDAFPTPPVDIIEKSDSICLGEIETRKLLLICVRRQAGTGGVGVQKGLHCMGRRCVSGVCSASDDAMRYMLRQSCRCSYLDRNFAIWSQTSRRFLHTILVMTNTNSRRL